MNRVVCEAKNHAPAAGPGPLRLVQVDTLEGLQPYEQAWNRLAWESPHALPMQSYAWMASHLERALRPGEGWSVLLALEGQELVGVLPVKQVAWRVLFWPRLRLRAPQQRDILSVDFLAAPGRAGEVIGLFLEALSRLFPGWYDFSLPRIPEESPTLDILGRDFGDPVILRQAGEQGSFLPIRGSFEAYQASLKGKFRKNLNKAREKLAKLPEVQAVFLTGAQATEAQLEEFLEVEMASWKGRAGTAIKQKPLGPGFFKALTGRLSQLGWLEWHFLRSGDQTLAGHLAVKFNRKLILFKIGYNEQFAACAPGNMLLEQVIQRAFASGDTEEINCLTHLPWNDNWAMSCRHYYDFWLYPRNVLSLATGVGLKRLRAQLAQVPAVRAAYEQLRGRLAGRQSPAPSPGV